MLNSPLHSFILAEIFGLFFVILSVVLLSRENYYRKLFTHEPRYPSVLACSVSLLLSIFFVMVHNLWVMQPRVLVTVVCWGYLLWNVVMLAYPEWFFKQIRQVCMGKMYYFWLLCMLLLGMVFLVGGSISFYVLIAHPAKRILF